MAEVRGLGLLLAVELEGHDSKAVAARLLELGAIVNAITPTALRLAPSLLITDDEIDHAVALLAEALGMTRHVLEIDDLSAAEVAQVLDLADDPARPPLLAGQTVGLYFEKPSLRTRHSCETAVVQLAGHPVTFRKPTSRRRRREPIGDIARVLSGYHAALGARVFDHRVLEQLAAASSIPVVNLLSDSGHPCQSLADLLTMRQAWGALAGRTIAWIGDFNNVARSLALGAALSGMRLRIASPAGYGPSEADVDRLARRRARRPAGRSPTARPRPRRAPTRSTRTCGPRWARRTKPTLRHRAFEGFQVDDAVMAAAAAPRRVHALPPRPPRRGGGRQRRRRAAELGLPPGPQPPPRLPRPPPLPPRGRATMTTKPQRQHRIAKLLAEQAVTSQAPPRRAPAAEGVQATQATVSRDLEDLGAIKVRVAGGDTVYAIPELPDRAAGPEDHLRRVFGDWVVEVNHSGNLVVLRTPPGSAHVVGSALDRSGLPERARHRRRR